MLIFASNQAAVVVLLKCHRSGAAARRARTAAARRQGSPVRSGHGRHVDAERAAEHVTNVTLVTHAKRNLSHLTAQGTRQRSPRGAKISKGFNTRGEIGGGGKVLCRGSKPRSRPGMEHVKMTGKLD